MNDILGRLPLYYHYSIKLGLIISRELQFISFLTGEANGGKFDRMAIAQYLLFGYPLGERILQADIFRVKPASLIRIHNNNKSKEKQFKMILFTLITLIIKDILIMTLREMPPSLFRYFLRLVRIELF